MPLRGPAQLRVRLARFCPARRDFLYARPTYAGKLFSSFFLLFHESALHVFFFGSCLCFILLRHTS
jgi:hypothetical protein